jgi:hypothetical protein
VAVLPAHLVARWPSLEHFLDYTPAPARGGSLRLDDDGVPYLSDHAKEPSAFRALGNASSSSIPVDVRTTMATSVARVKQVLVVFDLHEGAELEAARLAAADLPFDPEAAGFKRLCGLRHPRSGDLPARGRGGEGDV